MSQFRIALAQVESLIGTETFDPRPDNLARAERAVADAAAQGADLVLFGEMFLTGYHTDEWNPRYALNVDRPDPVVDQLATLAAKYGVTLMLGTATVSPDTGEIPRNSAILVSGNGTVGQLRQAPPRPDRGRRHALRRVTAVQRGLLGTHLGDGSGQSRPADLLRQPLP